MNNFRVKAWAIALSFVGFAIFFYKHIEFEIPLTPQTTTDLWTVQAEITFQGRGRAAKVGLFIPKVTPGMIMLDQDYISGNFGLNLSDEKDNRKADWAIRRAQGQKTLYYRASIAKTHREANWQSHPPFPTPPQYPEPYKSAIIKIIDDVRKASADVASYTRALLKQLNSKVPSENVKLLRNRARDDDEWASEIINVLQGVRIPARKIWGLDISNAANNLVLRPLLQVHNGDQWLTFHPKTGKRGIPSHFFVWKVGDKPVASIEGGTNLQVRFSVTKSYVELFDVSQKTAAQANSFLTDIALNTLPVQSQNVYRLLLMVPIGALLVVILRTFVGLQTFGTFMPILIALAFRETQLLWGVIMFSLIVSIGLMIRFYLEKLMLLLIPRLAAILVIVVILMLSISVITNQLGISRLLSISLFPMVILAMTIERMSITWEENGAHQAVLQGLGSLAVACVGYVVMTDENLMYLIFVFPELLLVVLGMMLWMGRYTGYRLVELVRFKAITKIAK